MTPQNGCKHSEAHFGQIVNSNCFAIHLDMRHIIIIALCPISLLRLVRSKYMKGRWTWARPSSPRP